MKATFVFAALVVALSPCAHTFGTITIDMVAVGDAGNPNDPATGNLYGGVDYAYNIGKYEVTVAQYTAFLNSVAAADTYGLYNYVNFQVTRSGVSGSYSYSVIDSPNHPISLVQWGNAARFANWLQNGQPIARQDAGTTEQGAYTLNGATSDAALITVTRTPGAKWFLPSESEWYKAAYYQPAAQGGDSDGYWGYPMRTNSVPFSDQPPGATPDNTRVGNFDKDDHVANGYDDGYAVPGGPGFCFGSGQNCLTDVGAYVSSPSYYGTFDQGGNVWEWNESVVSGGGPVRGYRGGAWNSDSSFLQSLGRREARATGPVVGFRVANTIPEPSSMVLSLAALVGLSSVGVTKYRRRRFRAWRVFA